MAGKKARRSGGRAAVFSRGTTSLWPDSTNTGYRNAPGYTGSLIDGSGLTSFTSGATYTGYDFGGRNVGANGSPINNVTFVGCRFKDTSVEGKLVGIKGGDNITFSYCSFEPGVAAPPVAYLDSYQYGINAGGSYGDFVQTLTVEYCDLWGFGNAIDVYGSTQAKPHTFRHNWIHDAADNGGSYHTDGIGSLSGNGTGSYLVMDHNTIESLGNTNGVAFQEGVYDHYTITNNLFGGFGYCVAIWPTSTNITFTDNTFSTRLQPVFGPLYSNVFATTTGSTWRRNKWKVPSGAAWGNPAHDGWYWMPVGGDASGSWNDTPFVSLTDFTG